MKRLERIEEVISSLTIEDADAWQADPEKWIFCVERMEVAADDHDSEIQVYRMEEKLQSLIDARETNAKISTQILALICDGKTMQQAFDAVIGEGEFVALAGELYDALRK